MSAFAIAFLALILGQTPSGVLTGKLLSRDGTPAAGVRVGAIPVDESKSASTLVSIVLTDELGQYRMSLPPGRYYIQAGRVDSPTYYPSSTTLVAAGAVSVAQGSDTTVPDFALRYPWELKVRGRVTGARPEELAGAKVQLYALSQAVSPLSTALSNDGSFEFERVPPGLAYLAGISISNPKSIAVTPVVPNADDGVELKLLRIMEVHGQVIVEGGGVMPVGMQIDSGPTTDFGGDLSRIMADGYQRTAGRRNTRLMGENTFFLRLTDGDHKITVSRLPEEFTVKSILYGSTDLMREPLKLRDAQVKEEIRVTIGPK